MGFTIYTSADASAPVLTGENDKLCALLRAVLVDGYGAKAAAGWTVAFDGTNKTAFQQGAGNGFVLRVQDDAPGAGAAKEARITGYESMSDVDTGSNPFPTAAQGVGGVAMVVARKSTTADTTARPWIIAADDRTLYAFVQTGDSANVYQEFMFGDFYSLLTSDGYRTAIVGRPSENVGSANGGGLDVLTTGLTLQAQNWIARNHSGTVGSVGFGRHGDYVKGGAVIGNGALPFTNPEDGGLYMSRVWIHQTTSPTGNLRGRLRGFWQFCHPVANITDRQIYPGTGELANRTFMFIKTSGNGNAFCIETSDTMETN